MLSLRPSSEPSQKAVLNLLPCKIHHTGSANAVEKHWSVVSAADTGFKTAHFRGRKLVAKDVSLPAEYTGMQLSPTGVKRIKAD
jgi:ribonuclease H2 subunit C